MDVIPSALRASTKDVRGSDGRIWPDNAGRSAVDCGRPRLPQRPRQKSSSLFHAGYDICENFHFCRKIVVGGSPDTLIMGVCGEEHQMEGDG